jgi:hypothetical protein
VAPFGNRVDAVRCERCGEPIGGRPFVDQVEERVRRGLARATRLCDSCKRRRAALALKEVAQLHEPRPGPAGSAH